MLCRIVNKQGFETTISYCDCVTTITDSVTGKSVYLDHNETGKIIQVRDDAGRYAKLTYLNGYLINICDVNNHNLFCTYDENVRVKSDYDYNNVKYFTNTYDNDGKVSTQVDGEDNSASTFVYDGDSRITTDRNGATSTRVFDEYGQLISLSTAKYLEENGYVPKTSVEEDGWKIPGIGFINGTETMAGEKRLENNEWNIVYVSAYIKAIEDYWINKYPNIVSDSAMLGTLYNQGHDYSIPHSNPHLLNYFKQVTSCPVYFL